MLVMISTALSGDEELKIDAMPHFFILVQMMETSALHTVLTDYLYHYLQNYDEDLRQWRRAGDENLPNV